MAQNYCHIGKWITCPVGPEWLLKIYVWHKYINLQPNISLKCYFTIYTHSYLVYI